MNNAELIESKLPISEAARKRNPHIWKATPGQSIAMKFADEVDAAKKRIRQPKPHKPTQLEIDWRNYMIHVLHIPASQIWEQAITLQLAPGSTYTPDFIADDNFHLPAAYETKGFMREDAREKLIHAAQRFGALFRFVLVWRGENKQWQQQEIRG